MNSWIGCWLWFLVFLVIVLKGHDPTIKMNLKKALCLHHDFEMWFHDLLATRTRHSVDVLVRSVFQSSVMVGVCGYLIPTAPKTNLIEPEAHPLFSRKKHTKPNQTLHFLGGFFPNVMCFLLYPRWIFPAPKKWTPWNELRVSFNGFMKRSNKVMIASGGSVSCHCYDRWFYIYIIDLCIYIYTQYNVFI